MTVFPYPYQREGLAKRVLSEERRKRALVLLYISNKKQSLSVLLKPPV